MIEIKTEGEILDIPASFSIEIEDSSPIFNDRGSQSVPVTVPVTRRNLRLLEAPHRLDSASDPNAPERLVEVRAGAYCRRGKMNVTEASKSKGITFNIGFDNATAYAAWQKKKLNEIEGLPVYYPKNVGSGNVIDILDELYYIYRFADPQADEFAVFPIAINNESTGTDEDKQIFWELLNVPGQHGMDAPASVRRLIDGEVADVKIPAGYGVSPFLRVWRVLEVLFDSLGLVIRNNPFKEDRELARLVVLNNAADTACVGYIKYADVLPDCTVEEFLNALWVRFGFVYNIDFSNGSVEMALLKDILATRSPKDVSNLVSGIENIKYAEKQYVKLSAASSIDGAAPASDRFEDFIKGLSLDNICVGPNVNDWSNVGDQSTPEWDGNVRDDYDPWDGYDAGQDLPDPEEYDPSTDTWDDDRYDDREDERDDHDSRSYSPSAKSVAESSVYLAREFITGDWYKLDAVNNKVKVASSPFFNWDPQPASCSAMELTSVDECVPVNRASNANSGSGNRFDGICPLYLVGARHYHSYIIGNQDNVKIRRLNAFGVYVRVYSWGGNYRAYNAGGRRWPADDSR